MTRSRHIKTTFTIRLLHIYKRNMGTHISERAAANLAPSKLSEIRSYCFYRQYDPVTNPKGIVALAVAENKLMRDEVTEHLNRRFNITPWHLTYGQGPAGSPALKTALANYMNRVFKPETLIEDKHVCMCNGAGSAVSNLGFCVGEPGEGILIGRPLYVGFFPDLEAHAKIKPVLVSMHGADPTSEEAVQHYETALQDAEANGTKIRALLLSSPHNPLGRPYTNEALVAYMRLCQKYNIHLISDEVYARSFFPSKDYPEPPSFVSVLSFPALSQHINPALVHVIYGMSKDFCANGIRVGALVSPYNPQMVKAFKSVASFSRASQLAEHVWLNLLEDMSWVEDTYFPALTQKMTAAYEYCTSIFKKNSIPYNAACVSSFIWFDLRKYLREDSQEAELELNWRMAKEGVWVAMGASFGSELNGFFRLTFASLRDELELGMQRMIKVLHEIEQEHQAANN